MKIPNRKIQISNKLQILRIQFTHFARRSLVGHWTLYIGNSGLRRSAGGYTFIEVLVALFMIGVMIIVFASSQQTLLVTKQVREDARAARIAERHMEEVRAMTFASIVSAASLSDPDLTLLPSGVASRTVGDFANDDADGEDELKLVTITVSWQSRNGPRSVSVSTLVSQGGINPGS